MTTPDSQVTTLDDSAPVVMAAPKPAKPAKPQPAQAVPDEAVPDEPAVDAVKMFHVTIHATGDDAGNDAVDIQPNGRLYRLPRGVSCLVPETVLNILKDAVVTTYKGVGDAVVEHQIPRFPFTATPA
jgi:hypothetical protein